MSVTYNEKKKQVIYQISNLDSDSESEVDATVEVLKIDNHSTEVLSKGIAEWQRILKDHKISEIGEIIEQLIILNNDGPEDEKIKQALADARTYQFEKSVVDRKKLLIKRDLNTDQFGNRVKVDYDKSVPDEQCRIVNEGRMLVEKRGPVLISNKPAPKNFGTKKYNPPLCATKSGSDPSDWLK